jgi:Flp pilus assembly protein TadD
VAATNAPLVAVPQPVRITNAAPAPAPVRPQPTVQASVVSNPPPRTVAAVVPAPASAPASAAQPSRVAAAQPLVTNPPVSRPLTNPAPAPAVATAAKPTAEVKPEIVPVDDSPKLQAARDGAAAVSKTVPAVEAAPRTTAPAPSAAAPAGTPAQTPLVEARPAESAPVSAPVGATSKESAGKPGFWGKVNPVRWGNPVKWFKDDPNASKPAKAPTPLTPVPAQVAVSKPVIKTNAPAVAVKPAAASNAAPAVVKSVAVPAPIPVVPRYASRSPQTLVAGDRAAAQAQFNEGIAAYDRKDLAGAIAAYQRATELDPTHFPSQHNLGWAALDSGDLTRALLAGEIAVRLDPSSANATRLFASALQRGNFPADAATQLERLIVLEPGDAAAHFTLAGLYARNLGQSGKARTQYLKVLELSPKHPQEAAIRVWLANHPQI